MSTYISPPAGMTEVDRETFFYLLYKDERDIMPSTDYREFTLWKITGTGGVAWGWSFPGWANPEVPKRYAIQSASIPVAIRCERGSRADSSA